MFASARSAAAAPPAGTPMNRGAVCLPAGRARPFKLSVSRGALRVSAVDQQSGSPAASTDTSTSTLFLKAAATNMPHPDKVKTGGEDAWFISTAGAGALGVADGVGGWADSGVDPGDYSKRFMKEAKQYLEAESKIDPFGALKAGHDKTRLPGSSTAVVLQLDPQTSKIEAANLGDSGFIVFRNGRVAYKSEPLQHYFDCPFQFGAYPEHVEMTDTPIDAQDYSLAVKAGDVIVMGSDGVWDNCFDAELEEIVASQGNDLKKLAESVAQLARKHAGEPDFESPYTNAAIAEGLDLPWWMKLLKLKIVDGKIKLARLTGGKMDDITVVAAVVTERPAPPAPDAAQE